MSSLNWLKPSEMFNVRLPIYPNRMGTFVTLAEVLEARGSPLDEDEVWCLLLTTTEALLDISTKGNHLSVLISSIIQL